MTPAVPFSALPALARQYRAAVACARYNGVCSRTWAPVIADLRAKITAARTGAPTWTDNAGSVWAAGGLLVGGPVPPPGGNSFTDPLGY